MTQQNVVDIEGMGVLKKQFKDLSNKMQRGTIRTALRSAAAPVLSDAKKRVPVATGALKKGLAVSVSVKAVEGKADIGVRRGKAGQPARRAHLVEFGTRHSRAQPFLRPALETKAKVATERFGVSIKREIDKVTAKVKQTGG